DPMASPGAARSPRSHLRMRTPGSFRAGTPMEGLPFLRQEGVAEAVEPPARPVGRLPDRVELPPHVNSLHEPPRGLVVREAVGPHPPQSEVLETDPDQFGDGFGRVPVPPMLRAQA